MQALRHPSSAGPATASAPASPPALSVIIPTRNEARHIADSVGGLRWAAETGRVEVIVVDNASGDGTPDLARAAGARVFEQGPERSAQRNRGAREAGGQYVLFLDADMRLPRETLEEILQSIHGETAPDALYVREHIVGTGFWVRVRNFERGFYDGTCIDALRVIRRSLFLEVGGYDEAMYAGEDWDLDRRLLARHPRVAVTRHALEHHEGAFSLRRYLRKKHYYGGNYDVYCRRWNYDRTIRRQYGPRYRFWGVFVENGAWRRAIRHPLLILAIWYYKGLTGWVHTAGKWRAALARRKAGGGS